MSLPDPAIAPERRVAQRPLAERRGTEGPVASGWLARESQRFPAALGAGQAPDSPSYLQDVTNRRRGIIVARPSDPGRGDPAQQLLRLRLSVDLLRRNYEELTVAVRYLTSPLVAHEMIGLEDRWHRQQAMGEVLQLLHNYVAAVKSLVDHTRRTYGKLYQPTGVLPSYQKEIDERFAKDPLSQFIENLREMSQHVRLPSIQFSHHFENLPTGGRMTHRLQLSRSDLLEYKQWSRPAKKFLADSGDKIDLLDIVTRHYAHVIAFHEWFREQQTTVHGAGPAIYERLTMHGLESPEPAIMEEVSRRVAALTSRPRDELAFQDLHEALLPALTVWDSRRLELCQHDAETWMEFAISAIGRRFDLGENLRKTLWGLVTPEI
jgi:hypothetical protein